MSDSTLSVLWQVLEERKNSASADSSYVAQLHAKGLNKILEKVAEESTETLLAAKDSAINGDKSHFVYEMADLWFHSMVLLSHMDCSLEDVTSELSRRFDLSGLAEKAQRNPNK